MSLTLSDIIYRFKQLDEFDAVDALGITTEDLAERFADIIEDKFDFFEQLLGDDNE